MSVSQPFAAITFSSYTRLRLNDKTLRSSWSFFTFHFIIRVVVVVVVFVAGVLLHAALAEGSDAANIKAVVGADALKLESVFRGLSSYLIAIDIADIGKIMYGPADGLACLRIIILVKF